MKQLSTKTKELYLVLAAIVAVIGLFAFRSIGKEVSDTETFFQKGISFNNAYKEVPDAYQVFIGKPPIDVILDSTEGRFDKIRSLKFDAYIYEKNYCREVVFIKKVTIKDTLIEPIRLDVYPENPTNPKKAYISYAAKSISYSYQGCNYKIARQVLPNISIKKIVPYTKHWQTAIPEVDNSMLFSEDVSYLDKEKTKTDSLSIGLNTSNSVYNFLFSKALKDNDIPFLSIKDNLKERDILGASEAYKNYSKANKIQLLYIQDDISFWDKLTGIRKMEELNFLSSNSESIEIKLNAFTTGNKSFAEVFDVEKLATYYALLNLYTNRNENSLFLNFNTETGLIEPFFVNKQLGLLNTYVKNLKIKDIGFLERYAQQLLNTTDLSNTQNQIDGNPKQIKNILVGIHQKAPLAIFDEHLFYHNKLIIEKGLDPSTATKITLIHYDDKQIQVTVENFANFPIQISDLSYGQQNKFITEPSNVQMIIMPLEKKTVIFELPDSYNNLFVHKKKKTIGFIFDKDIFDLSVGYRIVGTYDLKYNTITPFQDYMEIAKDDDLFRKEADVSSFKFLSVDESKKEISFISDAVVLDQPLVFPEGYMVKASAGLQIDIKAGGKIISKSPLQFLGSKKTPIKIYSSDGNGQGLFVVGSKKTSQLEYVQFDNLTNLNHGLWNLTGAVVFYESPVNLNHVLIANNSCEDGLNIIRTTFTMNHTTFRNTQSDAFDGDFVQGSLSDCTFEMLGNDAVDISGSKLELYNLSITEAGDKAISAGEDSQINGKNIKISNSEIAVAGKDLSIVDLTDVTISNTKLGFTAFQKKPEFGSSDIRAKNVVMTQVETAHLVENESTLELNGKTVKTIEQVKEQMYGVEFGVDSKETRVKR